MKFPSDFAEGAYYMDTRVALDLLGKETVEKIIHQAMADYEKRDEKI
jgi:hypothetical protein